MTAQWALTTAVPKPWGRPTLAPWSAHRPGDAPLGEVWFRPAEPSAPRPALLAKLLFTSEALSIQVHPDDEMAARLGLPEGKSEAWYVLDAAPGARVAIGLLPPFDDAALREAIATGRVADVVAWRPARAGDGFSVPAGTIHAVGAGLVIAEVQQNCDATFRFSDPGRNRPLHIAEGLAALHAGPPPATPPPAPLGDGRTLVVRDPHFVLERLDLPPDSAWHLWAERETWLVVIAGDLRFAGRAGGMGEALFVEDDAIVIEAGAAGAAALLAYPGAVRTMVHPHPSGRRQEAAHAPAPQPAGAQGRPS